MVCSSPGNINEQDKIGSSKAESKSKAILLSGTRKPMVLRFDVIKRRGNSFVAVRIKV